LTIILDTLVQQGCTNS